MLVGGLGFSHWKGNAYLPTKNHKICGAFCVLLVVIYQLWMVFTESYDFTGLSAVFLSFNMIPTTIAVFRLTQVLKPFSTQLGHH